MVMIAYDDILAAVEAAENREREYCESFCKLNPEHRAERERIRGYILSGINDVYTEIIRLNAARKGY